MRYTILALAVIFAITSCKKDEGTLVEGVLLQQSGCYPGSWLVQIINPDPSRHVFICDQASPATGSNCSNSAMIVNVPAALAQPGKPVRFSNWVDQGILCFSSTMAPHHLEVSDLSAR